jgi:hypothetical protein
MVVGLEEQARRLGFFVLLHNGFKRGWFFHGTLVTLLRFGRTYWMFQCLMGCAHKHHHHDEMQEECAKQTLPIKF